MSACNIYNASGNLVWSLGDYGGVVCDIAIIPANTAMTLTYPDFAGKTLTCNVVSNGGNWASGPSITYPSSIPTVTFASDPSARTCYVWAF